MNETLIEQNNKILEALHRIEAAIASSNSSPPIDDYWVIGFVKLEKALLRSGLEVSRVKLQAYRNANILSLEECRNIGTPQIPRWRFHVGKCKATIAQFERLTPTDQRRILSQ